MKDILEGLNPAQKKAVQHIDGPLRILAGAGSGKTRVLTHKIAHLMNKKIEPNRILAVTFTNKAAQEMKSRVASLVGEEESKQALLSTYHSLCVRILRQDISNLGISSNFNIIDNLDQKQILRPIYKKHGVSSKVMPPSHMIEYISNNKSNLIDPDLLLDEAKTDGEKIKALMYKDYLAATKLSNCLDFDDLLIKVYKLFKKHKEVREKWRKKFDYILVDEFQDTSWIQYEIIKELAWHSNFTIVGDPDQTIYTWRGADVNLIINFDKDFKKAQTIKLEENYRSTKNILEAANKLISFNQNRLPKKLFSNASIGLPVDFHHAYSPEAEAKWVAQKIIDLQKSKIQLKNIAVFYRSNYLSRTLEQAMIYANIPYKIYGDVKFFERQEIKDAIAFLKVINTGDEVSLQRIINIPARKIGATALTKLNDFAASKNMTLFKTITGHFASLPVSAAQKNSLALLFNLFSKYRAALKTNSISLIISKFLIEVGYISSLKQFNESGRIENINELTATIKSWEKKNPDATLEQYLQEVSLISAQDNIEEYQTSITLMTIHTSKGLEFDNVFIVGVSEQVFPSPKAIASGDSAIEEERRLAYVAVTRARKRLYISDSRGYSADHRFMKKPSRFITEMGLDTMHYKKELLVEGVFDQNYNDAPFKLRAKDKIEHKIFGKGVVTKIEGNMAHISFGHPHGKKILMKNHKSLKRI